MKELPPFTDFVKNIDIEKLGFDLEFFQRMGHYNQKEGPLPFKEKLEVSQIAASILLAYLQEYHIWLSSELQKREDHF